jgi:alpha,alpha-trehalose phosphorylase (configuration-retaining)
LLTRLRLDGLNKRLSNWDLEYYLGKLGQLCQAQNQPSLEFPARGYFVHVAGLGLLTGVLDSIKSYARYRDLVRDKPRHETCQLLICGQASSDDPVITLICEQMMSHIQNDHPDIAKDIIIVRLPPIDKILNTTLELCTVLLQFSTRDAFDINISSALHKVSSSSSNSLLIHLYHHPNNPQGQTSNSDQNNQ